jgi:hypothetical protein
MQKKEKKKKKKEKEKKKTREQKVSSNEAAQVRKSTVLFKHAFHSSNKAKNKKTFGSSSSGVLARLLQTINR